MLRAELEGLATVLDRVAFRLPGSDDLDGDRSGVVRTIREYLVPRLRDPDAPVVASIVGPSGTGKSTVLNSLAGEPVSAVGAVRPTTRAPVLMAHRSGSGESWSEFVARMREHAGPDMETVVSDDPLVASLTLVDTPPLGYTAGSGRDATDEVIAISDLCVFVTSPLRYADQASWDVLRRLRQQGIPVLFVLNRLPPDDGERDAVARDYVHRLHEAGLLADPDPELLFLVEEDEGSRDGVSTAEPLLGLRDELSELADPDFRQRLLDQTTEQAVRGLTQRAASLASDLDAEVETLVELDRIVAGAYATEADHLRSEVESGSLAWLVDHDHWPTAAVDLTGIVTRRAGDAAQSGAESWAVDLIGSTLLSSGGQGLWRHGHDTTYETQRRLDAWFESLGSIAGRRTKRGEFSARRRRKYADELWRATFDPAFEVSRRLSRTVGDVDAVLVEARAALAAAIRGALDFDAARFSEALGGTTAAPLAGPVQRHVDAILAVLSDPDAPEAPPADEATAGGYGEDPSDG